MKKLYTVKTDFGTYKVRTQPTKYLYTNNLAVLLDGVTQEPFATITVNLPGHGELPADTAFVDTNNCPWAEDFLTKNGLAEKTNTEARSGYCIYPLYRFDMEKLNE